MPLALTADRGLLFRITHIANVPWLMRHGLHAASSAVTDPEYVAIGNPDLIAKRSRRSVPLAPYGTLSDYVPFYFTPKSPMLYNIKTGHRGIQQRSNDDIVILISSCRAMAENSVTTLYTDRHAYIATATWTATAADLGQLLDWDILSRHDFSYSEDYPDKMERYQAEALAHRHVPPSALLGLACASHDVATRIELATQRAGASVKVLARPGWYFS